MKKLKYLFTILLTIICITNVSHAASLDYGLYNVKNDVYHEQEIGMNMARTYLNETMRVDARTDGTYYYTVEFSGTEYMNKHRILVNGSTVSTTKKYNSSKGTVKLTFKVKSLSSKIKAKLYVDAMERDVVFQIIPNFNTAQCVKKYTKKAETTKTEKDNKDSKNKTSKNESTKSDSTKKVSSDKASKKDDSTKEKEEKIKSESDEKAKEEKEESDKKEKSDEKVKEETNSSDDDKTKEEEKTETEKVSSDKYDESKSSKTPIIIGGIAILVIIGAVVFIKKRK